MSISVTYTGLAILKRLINREYLYELRIDLEDWEGNTSYAKYNRFWIGDYTENYNLTAQMYSGTAGNYWCIFVNSVVIHKHRGKTNAGIMHSVMLKLKMP